MSAQKNSQAAPKVKKRPQLYNTLPTEILPKNTFGIIEDENSEVFERIKAERKTVSTLTLMLDVLIRNQH